MSEDEIDAALERAAQSALNGRGGTIVVLDAQTGRIRAMTNSRAAFAESFPPGSAIKPFTLLAALRSKRINEESRVLCREHYKRDDFEIHCSHPRFQPPFDPAQALAYSCNYYFSKLAERLNGEALKTTLAEFGFGARTKGDASEATGALPRRIHRLSIALGDDPQLLVTPAQLITAYAAIFNGGHLFAPELGAAREFRPQERAPIRIAPEHRALLLKGMRGAVSFGTAARAGLDSLPVFVFGKTGTSTPVDDFRATHGWFVGFGAQASSVEEATPESVHLAVLVFQTRARGAECAEMARPIFEEYARAQTTLANLRATRDENFLANEQSLTSDESLTNEESLTDRKSLTDEKSSANKTSATDDAQSLTNDARARLASSSLPVRVRSARAGEMQTLALDDYLFGVLAAEASLENELEALKAQAVISRTFALKNMRRHARDGYDFCDSTHCQRFMNVTDESARPEFYNLLHRAIAETSNEVLFDNRNRLADAYFSASCGGMTANIKSLWGVDAPIYLRGVRDENCAGAPFSNWTDVISSADLLKALRGDKRADAGARLDNLRVVKRDGTGRAELISIEGEHRRLIRGWDFKIIVGRALGWSKIKSTRFAIERAGANFIFHGSGFGHGLGLCQTGAHVMAARGASYRQILERYFPGARTGNTQPNISQSGDTGLQEKREVEIERRASLLTRHSARGEAFAQASAWKADMLLRQETRLNFSREISAAIRSQTLRRADPFAPPRAPLRLMLSSENFRISYPTNFARRDSEAALNTLEDVRADLIRRLAAASLNFNSPRIEIYVHETTGDFIAATNQPSWAAAAARERRIELQPFDVLRRRGVFKTTLRHEYAHIVIDAISHGRAPRWLSEGLSAYIAGEGAMLLRFAPKAEMSLDALEWKLAHPTTAQEMRALYAASYREVVKLIQRRGEDNLWRRVAHYSTQ